jgi:hypothetical protein
MKNRLTLKLKSLKKETTLVLKQKEVRTGLGDDLRRYLCPLAEDLPLLIIQHYDNEHFERVDGWAVVHRWEKEGTKYHKLLFYPAYENQIYLETMEKENPYGLEWHILLLKILKKFGYVNYNAIPMDVSLTDFDKYLTPKESIKKSKINLKLKLQLLKLKNLNKG